MKRFLNLAAFALIAVVLPFSLVSCSSDDDDDAPVSGITESEVMLKLISTNWRHYSSTKKSEGADRVLTTERTEYLLFSNSEDGTQYGLVTKRLMKLTTEITDENNNKFINTESRLYQSTTYNDYLGIVPDKKGDYTSGTIYAYENGKSPKDGEAVLRYRNFDAAANTFEAQYLRWAENDEYANDWLDFYPYKE